MRRLVLATLVVGVVAAANAGPAMADGPPKLSDVLADPLGTVTETAATTVEDVTVVVDSTVQEVEGTVNEVVEGAGSTLETVTENQATAPPAPASTPTATSAVENPASSSVAAPAVAPDNRASPVAMPPVEPQVGTPGRLPVAGVAGRTASPVSSKLASELVQPATARRGTAETDTAPSSTSLPPEPEAIGAASVDVQRTGMSEKPRSDDRSQAEPPLPAGFAIDLPSPVSLVVALLGLLALTAPRPRGPRLRPAVATAHAADVRFRLVRPG
jgi:hypothetical protein